MSKKLAFVFLLLVFSILSYSQNTAITDDDSYSPHPSAMLDVKSLTKGVLIPRISSAQRLLLSPVAGLLVYDATLNRFFYHNGTTWLDLATPAESVWGASVDDVYLYNPNMNLGVGSTNPNAKLEVKADASIGPEDAIFHVLNVNGDTIFAVYPEGVRINVIDDPLVKASGSKGGFAVGGFSPSKGGLTNEYLHISPDSVRVYIEEGNYNKASGSKGGFAVGGFSPSKAGLNTDYLNIFGSNNALIINPSQARILWYPLKEAFMAGKVLVEGADSVGTNSMSTGFESKAIGNYSQAFGYKARAFGQNSSALGYFANANASNSFALGNYAHAGDTASYAIGTYAQATGLRSFAIGSKGVDLYGFSVGSTTASGDYSYAFGMGAQATAQGAFSIGTKTTASGDYSTAIGYRSTANNQVSTAIGNNCTASGAASVAIGTDVMASGQSSIAIGSGCQSTEYTSFSAGNWCRSEGSGSVAMGSNTIATGHNGSISLGYLTNASGGSSVALGSTTLASGDNSTAIGGYTIASGYGSTAMGSDIIVQGERSFGIGLNNPWPSSWTITQNNTMAIMGGNVGIGTVAPDKLLHVAGDARIEGDIYYGTGTNKYNKPDFVFSPDYKKISIHEVSEFLKKNSHLPWLTSAKNESDGVNITRMTFETLEAVENIQLQIIDLKNENDALKSELNYKNIEIDNIKTEIEKLKKQIK
jgi:hypothetical protein